MQSSRVNMWLVCWSATHAFIFIIVQYLVRPDRERSATHNINRQTRPGRHPLNKQLLNAMGILRVLISREREGGRESEWVDLWTVWGWC